MRFTVFCRQLEHVVGLGALLRAEDAFRDERFTAVLDTLEQASLQAAAFERSYGTTSASVLDAPAVETRDAGGTAGCTAAERGGV